ncbi:MAG: aspartate 1-decarboxylase, partial [Melioribacteraceae bacterium]|nr:aspartate 1-decarboxylase [Melioribacteraceae bacterium]
MKRTLLKSKIHRATVTGADLNYEGSISIDKTLCDKADLIEFEKVD